MKKNIKLLSYLLCSVLLLLLVSCSTDYPTQIPNGDFEELTEDGKWKNWTREDAAFNVRGITDEDKINGAEMHYSGEQYFSGYLAGNPVMRGTLTSDPFELQDTGVISFKMGAGQDPEKVYVEFIDYETDEVLAKVGNEDVDGIFITEQLLTQVVDLSDHIGKVLYIKVTDDDDGQELSYVNLDDFKVLSSEEEIKAAEDEYLQQIEEFGPKPFEEDPSSEEIQNPSFETGDTSGWMILEGNAFTPASVVPSDQLYWDDRSVYAVGDYYVDGSNNGAIPESNTGSMRSSKFTLGGDGYISFMMGAGNGECYVAICDAETDEELIKVYNEGFSDPSTALTLLRTYVDASDYLGQVLYIKVVDDNDGSGFAFLNVDDFRVSLTESETAELQSAQLEAIKNADYNSDSYDDISTLIEYYTNYDYPVEFKTLSFDKYIDDKVLDLQENLDITQYLDEAEASYGDESLDVYIKNVEFNDESITEDFENLDISETGYYHVNYATEYENEEVEAQFTIVAVDNHNQVPNGGFESGNLAAWEVLNDDWAFNNGNYQGVISAENYWDEALPYNQSGDYHLDGWNNGIPEEDTWAIRSHKFILDGSGFISLKMGGNAAAARVFTADGTEIGYYKQNRFNDDNFPSLVEGGSWADMATYVIDLSDYLGEELYIELHDEEAETWAQAFFDEVITYYEEIPDYENNVDTVPDGGSGEPVDIPWQLAENHLD